MFEHVLIVAYYKLDKVRVGMPEECTYLPSKMKENQQWARLYYVGLIPLEGKKGKQCLKMKNLNTLD